jgi:hypothetical protein
MINWLYTKTKEWIPDVYSTNKHLAVACVLFMAGISTYGVIETVLIVTGVDH